MYPTLFTIPFLPTRVAEVKSYGVMMAIAFLTGIWMACRRAERSRENPEVAITMGFVALIAGVIGARAMFALHYWESHFAQQPCPIIAVLDIQRGGLEFWGGPLLTIPALLVYLKLVAKKSIRRYFDIAAPSLAWGLAITRIGCFLNGCCWGAVCVDRNDPGGEKVEYPWAVRFPYDSPAMVRQFQLGMLTLPMELVNVDTSSGERRPVPRARIDDMCRRTFSADRIPQSTCESAENTGAVNEGVDLRVHCDRFNTTPEELSALAQHYRSLPVHPVQIYECISALLVFGVLNRLFYRRHPSGTILPWFLVLYSVCRIALEFIRHDNPRDVVGLTISQAISMGMFAVGGILLLSMYSLARQGDLSDQVSMPG